MKPRSASWLYVRCHETRSRPHPQAPEIAIKARIGKLAGVSRLLADFDSLIQREGFKHLTISHSHAILAGGFKVAHRDPFDRMLVAQALSENALLLSNDAELSAFGVATVW